MEENCPTIETVLKHFGYDPATAQKTWMGNWANEENMIERLGMLPEVLRLLNAEEKKFRVVFDYDPDYPKALLQVWGLETSAIPPGMDTPLDTPAKKENLQDDPKPLQHTQGQFPQ